MPSSPRLLVIDDNPAVRQVVTGLGRAVGFDVVGCDGDHSLEECLATAMDLIILDLVMPVHDGIEVIERLGRNASAARLVLVSGQDRRVLASASRLASAHGLRVAATFTKPFRGSDLRACLAEQKGVLSDTDTARARRRSPTIRRERIEQALRTREILVYYQPQVAIDTLEWVGVAMNVEADVLAHDEFVDLLVAAAAEAGLEHERIVLEVTETTLPADPMTSLAIQTRLRVRCVAEGVEDPEALQLLAALNCGFAQGYFIGPPMPGGELACWAARWAERRTQILPRLG